jgi:3-(3-hydroxy-phenyl)propionate hydroxylase
VGALAALELARNGMSVVLLEARSEVAWTSRAICISRRSLEILDRAGVGEPIRRKGLPWSKGKTFHRDRLVFELELPHNPGDRHPPFINLQQCYTEQFLIDAVDAHPSIELRWGHRVTEVVESGGSVSVNVAGPDDTYTIAADWLVAADGARSVVRRSLGLAMTGTSYEGRYLISDIEVEGADWPVERHVWFDAPANPGSTVILHVQPDSMWRIDMQLHEHEDPEDALRDQNLLPRIQSQLDMMGVHAPWRLVWKSVYRAHSLSLDSYRHGRVLFAGDAAHLVPIFGVRGLNSGFDDAHNLAWKLAMVTRGDAPDALLDSYSAERRTATAENIANADKSTWFMSPPTDGFRRMRDATLRLAHDHEWARSLINPRQSSFHVYESSPVVVHDEAPEVGVRPAAPIPNLPYRGNHLQLALPPTGFSALLFEQHLAADQISKAEHECASLGIATIIIAAAEEEVANRFAAERFPLYLIRPDEHVAARLSAGGLGRLRQAYSTAIEGQGGAPAWDVRGASPIEDIYEALSLALDRSEAAADSLALERIALALANGFGDPRRARELIEQVSTAGSCGSGGDSQ